MSNGFINVKHRFYARNTFFTVWKAGKDDAVCIVVLFFIQDVLYWDGDEISEIL